jgi:hypothetical protein
MDTVKPTLRGALLDGVRGQAQLPQLIEAEDRVLPRSKRSNRRIQSSLALKRLYIRPFGATPAHTADCSNQDVTRG